MGQHQIQNGAISTLVAHTEQHRGLSAIIVCGYYDRMMNEFFGLNEGLNRRFPEKFHIDNYNSDELTRIFIQFLHSKGISLTEEESNIVFTMINSSYTHIHDIFSLQAGDMETLSSIFIDQHQTQLPPHNTHHSEEDDKTKNLTNTMIRTMKSFKKVKDASSKPRVHPMESLNSFFR